MKHFSRVKFRGIPYHQNEPLPGREITEEHKFNAFLHESRDYMAVRYAKKVANELADRLGKVEHSAITVQRPHLDLKELIRLARFRPLYGTYFSDLEIPHVHSSALFGEDVDDSQFFDTFSALGGISAIITAIEFEGADYKVMLTKDYGIGFYMPDLPHEVELQIIEMVKPVLDEVRVPEEPEPDVTEVEVADELQEELFVPED